MTIEVHTMSDKELKKLDVIKKIVSGQLTYRIGAEQLCISPRQLKRIVKKFRSEGIIALISKKRGKTSNRTYGRDFKEKVIKLVETQYRDFKPLFASQMLLERDRVQVSSETLRRWMSEAGLWNIKNKKVTIYHPRRTRRAQYGELVQIDGSYHDWFEGRNDDGKYCLIVFIDDATSRIMKMRFYPHETTEAYFDLMRLYIIEFGLPMSLYSDKHGVFRVNAKEAKIGTGQTQFGRAMKAIGIELIHAHSPQAKGRVERCNETLQDRLVKWMRLEGINNPASANPRLDEYRDLLHNNMFAVQPKNPINAHIFINDLTEISRHFVIISERIISKSLTISYENKIYQLDFGGMKRRLHNKIVSIREDFNQGILIEFEGKSIPYTIYDKQHHLEKPVDAKELEVRRIERLLVKKNKYPQYTPTKNYSWTNCRWGQRYSGI